MKFSVPHENLLAALQQASKVVPATTTIDSVLCFKLSVNAADSTLVVSATDLNRAVVKTVEGIRDAEDGEVLVNAKKFLSTIASLTQGGIVQCKELKSGLKVICGRDQFSILVRPPKDFPNITPVQSDIQLKIPATTLRDMINRVSWASAKEEGSSYALDGVLFESEPDRFSLAASNRHRLAVADIPIPPLSGAGIKVVVPNKSIAVLVSVLHATDGDVLLSFTDRRMGVSWNGLEFSTTLLNGNFPKYRLVIPDPLQYTATLQMQKEALGTALLKVSNYVDEDERSVAWKLEDSSMILHASSIIDGEADVVADIRLDGEPFKVNFVLQYWRDVLKVIQRDEVVINFKNDDVGLLTEQVGSLEYMYLVMGVAA